MKIAILNVTGKSKKTILAHSRFCNFLEEQFGWKYLDDNDLRTPKCWDILFVANGMLLYTKDIKALYTYLSVQKKVVFMTYDYLMIKKSWGKFFEDRGILVQSISNFYNDCGFKNWQKFDMNRFTYEEGRITSGIERKGLVYYGALRKKRVSLFKKYLSDKRQEVFISPSTTKESALCEWLKINSEARFFNMNGVVNSLCNGKYKATVYMTDDGGEKWGFVPACRFYECLSAGIFILIDKGAVKDFEGTGLDIEPYIVNNSDDVYEKMKNNYLIQKQFDEFSKLRNYKLDLIHDINSLVEKVSNG